MVAKEGKPGICDMWSPLIARQTVVCIWVVVHVVLLVVVLITASARCEGSLRNLGVLAQSHRA